MTGKTGRAIASLISLGLIPVSCGEQGSGAPDSYAGSPSAGSSGARSRGGRQRQRAERRRRTIDVAEAAALRRGTGSDAGGASPDGGIPDYTGNECPG